MRKFKCVSQRIFGSVVDRVLTIGKTYNSFETNEGTFVNYDDGDTCLVVNVIGEIIDCRFEEVKEMFGKKDMENGMICLQRCGAVSIWLNGEHYDLIEPDSRVGNFTDGVTEDLLNGNGSGDYDIISVYVFVSCFSTPTAIRSLMASNKKNMLKNMKLVWERTDERKQKILDKIENAEKELQEARKELDKLD